MKTRTVGDKLEKNMQPLVSTLRGSSCCFMCEGILLLSFWERDDKKLFCENIFVLSFLT